MLRGKPPDAVTGGRTTVDWHQDAEYTYYWYSPVNTTVDTMDRYAGSIVNAWLALEDVDVAVHGRGVRARLAVEALDADDLGAVRDEDVEAREHAALAGAVDGGDPKLDLDAVRTARL